MKNASGTLTQRTYVYAFSRFHRATCSGAEYSLPVPL
jgi:hypothetical protein